MFLCNKIPISDHENRKLYKQMKKMIYKLICSQQSDKNAEKKYQRMSGL